jgi:hypothetical protein
MPEPSESIPCAQRLHELYAIEDWLCRLRLAEITHAILRLGGRCWNAPVYSFGA